MKKNITLFLLIGGMLLVPVQSMADNPFDQVRRNHIRVEKALKNRGSTPITDPRESAKEKPSPEKVATVEQGRNWRTFANGAAAGAACATILLLILAKFMDSK